MEQKIAINLLPQEFIAEQLKKGKFYRVQALGISVILLMVFLSVLTLSLRIIQSTNLKSIQVRATEDESRVSSLSNKQASLVLLKNRLDAINQYLGTPSKQAEMYNLVNSLLPASFEVSAVSVTGDGIVLVSGLASDSTVLEQLFNDLLDKQKNEGKISKVSLESLNRGRDGVYRVSFKVTK